MQLPSPTNCPERVGGLHAQHAWQRLWDRLLAEPSEPHVQPRELEAKATTNEAVAGDDRGTYQIALQNNTTSSDVHKG